LSIVKRVYECPRCSVSTSHNWYRFNTDRKMSDIYISPNPHSPKHPDDIEVEIDELAVPKWDLKVSVCDVCFKYSIYENNFLVFPKTSPLPKPDPAMPDNVKVVYQEAMAVFPHSKRATGALLRLTIELLLPQLEDFNFKTKGLFNMIGELEDQKVPEYIRNILDLIRLEGNSGIHTTDFKVEDEDEIRILFEWINLVVHNLIGQRKKINDLYNKIPAEKMAAIEKRNYK
jgi:hypothetical protein